MAQWMVKVTSPNGKMSMGLRLQADKITQGKDVIFIEKDSDITTIEFAGDADSITVELAAKEDRVTGYLTHGIGGILNG